LTELLDPVLEVTAVAQLERLVLDTSALVSDPEALFAFPGAEAVIPLTVVEELDSLKTRLDDVGRAARAVLRELRLSPLGVLSEA